MFFLDQKHENIIFQRYQPSGTEGSGRLTMLQILRHFAVKENIALDKMTTLLKLFKKHQPEPMYEYLPSTGRELLPIDGLDVGIDEKKLPSPTVIGITISLTFKIFIIMSKHKRHRKILPHWTRKRNSREFYGHLASKCRSHSVCRYI